MVQNLSLQQRQQNENHNLRAHGVCGAYHDPMCRKRSCLPGRTFASEKEREHDVNDILRGKSKSITAQLHLFDFLLLEPA